MNDSQGKPDRLSAARCNDESLCTCPSDEHTCPFQEDVNNDSDFTCTCCEQCEHECAMSI